MIYYVSKALKRRLRLRVSFYKIDLIPLLFSHGMEIEHTPD